MTSFSVKVSDPDFTKTITDFKGCKTIDEFKQEIAKHLNIEAKFTIENPPNVKDLSSIPNNSVFNLQITERRNDIKFHLPNGKKQEIKNCYKMKLEEILKHFEEKGYYYSPLCVKQNLQITYNKKPINLDGYPFFAATKSTRVEVILKEKTVPIEYLQKKFVFSNKETCKEACLFINQSLKNLIAINSIFIQAKGQVMRLKENDKLKFPLQYEITIESTFKLKCKSKSDVNSNQKLNYLSKISDLRKLLVIIYSDYHNLKAENIHIFDKDDREVHDENSFVKDVQKADGTVYFDIDSIKAARPNIPTKKEQHNEGPESLPRVNKNKKKFLPRIKSYRSSLSLSSSSYLDSSSIPINFVFDEKNEKDYMPFKESIELTKTMKEISEMIAQKYSISNNYKIELQYECGKSKVSIDREMNIQDVKDDIRKTDKNGDSRNYLFVLIKKAKKSKKRTAASCRPNIHSIKISKEKFDLGDDNQKDDGLNDYTFEFNGQSKTLRLNKNSSIKDNEDEIKNAFNIKDEADIDYSVADYNNNENDIDMENELLVTFNNSIIKITEEKVEENVRKYFFQTNRTDEIFKVKLEVGSTVKQLKSLIANMFSVKYLANVKIIFAGKDLLNDLILDQLELGDTVLYVYIRTEEDNLLMTAKALRINLEDLDEYDEFEEEEEDNS